MANVIQPFRDRLTWVAYAPGDEYAGERPVPGRRATTGT